jgi:hypothetical protein
VRDAGLEAVHLDLEADEAARDADLTVGRLEGALWPPAARGGGAA